MFITNNHASFHFWREVSKYYDNDFSEEYSDDDSINGNIFDQLSMKSSEKTADRNSLISKPKYCAKRNVHDRNDEEKEQGAYLLKDMNEDFKEGRNNDPMTASINV